MGLTTAQIANLKTELQTDPLALGYATLIAAGNDGGLTLLINDVTKATAGPKVTLASVSTEAVLGALVFAELSTLTTNQLLILSLICGVGTVNPSDTNTKSIFAGLFGSGTQTRTNLTNLSQRIGSRIEQLFGTGIYASEADVSMALRGQ